MYFKRTELYHMGFDSDVFNTQSEILLVDLDALSLETRKNEYCNKEN